MGTTFEAMYTFTGAIYKFSFPLHSFCALAASCVLYNKTEHGQGFFICYVKRAKKINPCSVHAIQQAILKTSHFDTNSSKETAQQFSNTVSRVD